MGELHIDDRNTPRPLTIDELWHSWDLLTKEEQDAHDDNKATWKELDDKEAPYDRLQKYGCTCWRCAKLPGPFVTLTQYPSIRSMYALECSFMLALSHEKRNEKSLIVETLLAIASDRQLKPRGKYAAKANSLVRKAKVEDDMSKSVEEKLELAETYKAAGNDYMTVELIEPLDRVLRTDHRKWREAMKCYAKAWIALLPYHYHAFDTEDPRHVAMGKFECMLLSNVCALVIVAGQDTNVGPVQKAQILDLGIQCHNCVLSMGQFSTVALRLKTYKRGIHLWSLLGKIDTTFERYPGGTTFHMAEKAGWAGLWAARVNLFEARIKCPNGGLDPDVIELDNHDLDPESMYSFEMEPNMSSRFPMAVCPPNKQRLPDSRLNKPKPHIFHSIARGC